MKEKSDEIKRHCLQCGNEFSGRPDKKYCNPACKNAYNNDLIQRDVTAEIRRITNILKKNRNILKAMLGNATSKNAKKDIMMRKGFSFDYITQTEGRYRFCFEYGYTIAKGDYYMIVKGFEKIVSKE